MGVNRGEPGRSKGQVWSCFGNKNQDCVAVNHRSQLCQTKDVMGKVGRDGSQRQHSPRGLREQEPMDDSLRSCCKKKPTSVALDTSLKIGSPCLHPFSVQQYLLVLMVSSVQASIRHQ